MLVVLLVAVVAVVAVLLGLKISLLPSMVKVIGMVRKETTNIQCVR